MSENSAKTVLIRSKFVYWHLLFWVYTVEPKCANMWSHYKPQLAAQTQRQSAALNNIICFLPPLQIKSSLWPKPSSISTCILYTLHCNLSRVEARYSHDLGQILLHKSGSRAEDGRLGAFTHKLLVQRIQPRISPVLMFQWGYNKVIMIIMLLWGYNSNCDCSLHHWSSPSHLVTTG